VFFVKLRLLIIKITNLISLGDLGTYLGLTIEFKGKSTEKN
jgi:hypothetical protein